MPFNHLVDTREVPGRINQVVETENREDSMNKHRTVSQWLLLICLAVSFYNVGAIWLTHVSVYPLWPYVGSAEFEAFHLAWWRSIWGVLLPAGGLAVAGAVAMIWLRPPGVPARAVWLGITLQVLVWALTAAWWGPLMARLHQVTGPVYGPLYDQLMITHWGRVALFSAYGLLLFWMAGRSYLARGAEGAVANTART
jgi:hypothetical protein